MSAGKSMKKGQYYLIFCIFLLLLPASIAHGEENMADLSAQDLFFKMTHPNLKIKDYTSDIAVKVMITYASLHTSMELRGKYLYQCPDKCLINIIDKPAILSQFPEMFKLRLPRFEEYRCYLREVEEKENKPFHILELFPKKEKGDLEKYIIWVNRKDFTRVHEELSFAQGGKVMIFATYRNIEGNMLYHIVRSQFDFPKIRLKGHIEMVHRNHRINVGLPSDLFND